MMKRTILNLVATKSGLAMALAMGLGFFYFTYQSAQADRVQPLPTPLPNQSDSIPEIKTSDVISLTLETAYLAFFEENSKCRKSYDELYGKGSGFHSADSACLAEIVFNRDGSVMKSVELRRYDQAAREMRVVEKALWKSRITSDQFNALAEAIVSSSVFKDWIDGTQIYRRNTKITVYHDKGLRQLLSYVDKTTTAFLPLVDAFKQLDNRLSWQKVQ